MKKQKILRGRTNYRYLSTFGEMGTNDNQFFLLKDISKLTNGNIAINDMGYVKIFNSNGVFQNKFFFNSASGITQLTNGDIAIIDQNDYLSRGTFDVSLFKIYK